MKCKFKTCNNEAVGSSAYCSNSCRAKESKRNRTSATNKGATVTEAQPGQAQPEQVASPAMVEGEGQHDQAIDQSLDQTLKQGDFAWVQGEKVYGRQAVSYPMPEPWNTRPEPLNPDDQPVAGNRGRYKRTDGTVYQFDACGKPFEATNGQVYQTTEEVKSC